MFKLLRYQLKGELIRLKIEFIVLAILILVYILFILLDIFAIKLSMMYITVMLASFVSGNSFNRALSFFPDKEISPIALLIPVSATKSILSIFAYSFLDVFVYMLYIILCYHIFTLFAAGFSPDIHYILIVLCILVFASGLGLAIRAFINLIKNVRYNKKSWTKIKKLTGINLGSSVINGSLSFIILFAGVFGLGFMLGRDGDFYKANFHNFLSISFYNLIIFTPIFLLFSIYVLKRHTNL